MPNIADYNTPSIQAQLIATSVIDNLQILFNNNLNFYKNDFVRVWMPQPGVNYTTAAILANMGVYAADYIQKTKQAAARLEEYQPGCLDDQFKTYPPMTINDDGSVTLT